MTIWKLINMWIWGAVFGLYSFSFSYSLNDLQWCGDPFHLFILHLTTFFETVKPTLKISIKFWYYNQMNWILFLFDLPLDLADVTSVNPLWAAAELYCFGDDLKSMRALPLTKRAAIWMITVSIVYPGLQHCFNKSSVQIAPPPTTWLPVNWKNKKMIECWSAARKHNN